MRFVFAALQQTYEKVTYSAAQRELKAIDEHYSQHKAEAKEAFFRLGARNINVNMTRSNSLFMHMNEKNTDSSLFMKHKDKNKIINAFCPQLKAFTKEYLAGKEIFQEVQEAVKACAQKSESGTFFDEAELLYQGWKSFKYRVPKRRSFHDGFTTNCRNKPCCLSVLISRKFAKNS